MLGAAALSGTQALLPGCTAVTLTSFAGTPVSAIATLVAPQGVVTGIWRLDAVTQRYQAGFLAASGAPLNFSTTSGEPETYSVCTASGGTIHSG